MKGNATVQTQEDKKRKTVRFFIYLPQKVVRRLNIKKSNVVDFEMENPDPEYIAEPKQGLNFQKRNSKPEQNEEETTM